MAYTAGIQFTRPLLRLLLLLLLFVSLPFSFAQNCSYSYVVCSDPRGLCRGALSSKDGFKITTNLTELLTSMNRRIQVDDCLQLSLYPGTYVISYNTVLNYSAVFVAPSGNVNVTCLSTYMSGRVTSSPLRFNGMAGAKFVMVDGVAFEDCQKPLQFDDLDEITISNSSFRNFTASAVDLFNCHNITVQNSLFHNCSSSADKAQFRGNSGGLSISYNATSYNNEQQPSVLITNSQFTYNKANLPLNRSMEQIDLALNNYFYYGRGGGAGILINENVTNITMEIEDCLFLENYAESFGGGLYLNTNGHETHHNFVIRRCNFTSNSAGPTSFGGGVQVAMLIRNQMSPPTMYEFSDCHFQNNSAAFGGALSTVQTYSQGRGNNVTLTHSTFHQNTAHNVGSAVMFASLLYVQNRAESHHYLTEDCTFTDNTSPGGTFGAGFIHFTLRGENSFVNNTGPGLRIVGSLVSVQGNLSFIGNNAERFEGGALYISEFGQVKLYSGAQVDFINNTGRIGSAIVVTVQRSPLAFSELIYNPQCFLLHENSSKAPDKWDDVVVHFQGNRAHVGPAVYISYLDLCAWFSVVSENGNVNTADFSISSFTSWPVFNYTDGSNEATAHVNCTSSEFYFQTQAAKVTSTNTSIKDIPVPTWPGQLLQLNLVGHDQLGNPTYFIMRLSDSRSNINSGAFTQAGDDSSNATADRDIVRFDPALLPVQPNAAVVSISYGFPDISSKEFNPERSINITIDTPYNIRDTRFDFQLQFANCQPGYMLKPREDGDKLLTCACVDSDFDIQACDEKEDDIVLRDSLWAGIDLDSIMPHIHTYQCPTPYCSCHIQDQQTCETLFYQKDPGNSRQCHSTRRGSLCGECVNGTAVGVLRMNCRNCTEDNYFALGFLVVADALAICGIFLLSVMLRRAFPHSLKGLLFYIQTVYYATEFFPASFWDIRQYMLYISSILGLYFPWDFCLFPGMTALVSFAPHFIPSATAAIITTAILLTLFFCWPKEMRTRKYIWHGMWSLVLLLYAPLMHTCATLLHCPYLPIGRGEMANETYRWFLDGRVQCFRDAGHIALGLIAVVVLILLALIIPAMAIFTLVGRTQKVQNNSLAEKLYSAITDGYKEEVRWWGAWDLLRRLLLITIIVALPGRTVAPLFILLPAFALHLFLLPYHKWWQNLIEAAVLIDYILLFLLRSTQTFLDNLSWYTGTSVPDTRASQLAETDRLTWLYFPFFYLPVVFGACFCVGAIVYHVARLLQRQRQSQAFSEFVEISEDSPYGEFRHSTPVTTSEVEIPT